MKRKTASKILAAAVATAVLAGCIVPYGLKASELGWPFFKIAENSATTTLTGDELAKLVNPIVQKYEKDSSGKVWKMTQDSRFAVLATQENFDNERLAEVVKLVNSEFVAKNVISESPFAMVYANEGEATAADIFIVLNKGGNVVDGTDSSDAYTIEVGDSGVKVTAASENAVMYALRTIQNYIVANDGLAYGKISDYSDVEERRLHVDCGRKFFSKDWFIREIREMSFLKMNAIQIHFSENIGFRIECRTDPDIVSDEHLTYDDIKEILAEAKKYGVKVIPSIDSPGHVDYILRVHPEYGQINSDGDRYKSGLDVTNPKAVAYMRSIYDEYMELFEGCTDFHIGGDEYMEFDRPPFTTKYKSVLNDYARNTLGNGYIWKDVMANYINELAEHMYSKGFTPRVFNDGLYYGETDYEGAQKIQMHPYIGVDYWSKMSWNPSIAGMQTFINKGHTKIYNFNSDYMYYVLRRDGAHSFDHGDQERRIFEEWSPGKYAGFTASDDAAYIGGAVIGIWCDYPEVATEDVVAEDIADEMRSLACRSWNVDSNRGMTYAQFKEKYEVLGSVAGYEKGSVLPDAGEFQNSESLGKVTLKYVSDKGKTLKRDVVKFGEVGKDYAFEADTIYGYKLASEGSVKGTYTKEGEVFTFTFTLDCDKTALNEAIANALTEKDYIPESFAGYKAALEEAKAISQNAESEQTEVDAALEKLGQEAAKAVLLENFALYVEVNYPLSNTGYKAGYSEYMNAVSAAKEVLYSKGDDAVAVKSALDSIEAAKGKLMKPDNNTPTISADDGYYDVFSYDKMLDGNESSKCWFNTAQVVGKKVTFTFPAAVNMSQVRILQPASAGNDTIAGADVSISSGDGQFTKVGEITSTNQDTTIAFDKQLVKEVRLTLTAAKTNWYQIAEVYFTYEQIAEDDALKALIAEAEALDISGKDVKLVNDMIAALVEAQKLNAAGTTDTKAAQDALDAAIKALKGETPKPPVEPVDPVDPVDPSEPADKHNLEKLVKKADSIVSEKERFDADKYKELAAPLATAKEVLKNEKATQAQVKVAEDSLFDAVVAQRYIADKENLDSIIGKTEALNNAKTPAVAKSLAAVVEAVKAGL